MAFGTYDEYKTGMHVLFGAYEQDGNADNGKEDIEWIILDIVGDKALLLSDKVLDAYDFPKNAPNVEWKDSGLNQWLRGEFYNEAFRSYEKLRVTMMPDQAITFDENDEGINDYTDSPVSLLSSAQLNRYFPEAGDRLSYTTAYARSKGVNSSIPGAGIWYVREPGTKSAMGFYVRSNGLVNMASGSEGHIGVRPCVWVKLD